MLGIIRYTLYTLFGVSFVVFSRTLLKPYSFVIQYCVDRRDVEVFNKNYIKEMYQKKQTYSIEKIISEKCKQLLKKTWLLNIISVIIPRTYFELYELVLNSIKGLNQPIGWKFSFDYSSFFSITSNHQSKSKVLTKFRRRRRPVNSTRNTNY